MAIQNGKYASAREICFKQNRWPVSVVLPWRLASPAVDSAFAAPRSHVNESRLSSETETAFNSDRRSKASHPLSPAELHSLYAGTSVPQHRYLAPALVAAVHSPAIAMDPDKWFSGLEGIQLSSVVEAWLNTNSDTSFEQLKSVDFDPYTSQLKAVLTIKQSRGYAGGASTAGSREYVAFWVDWGSGFKHEGTTSLLVHDCGSLPASGLNICVKLPIDLSLHATADDQAAPAFKVRAVLSWNTPPSATHPYAQVVWGNSLTFRVAVSSQRAVRSITNVDVLNGYRCGISALNTDDLANHGTLCTLYRKNFNHCACRAASC